MSELMALLSSGWVLAPLALLLILCVARLARLHPAFRPLVAPFAASALAFLGLALFAAGRMPAGVLVVLALAPVLVLVVRSAGLAFRALFRRGRGAPPPALLESVVAVLLYSLGAGFILHRWLGVELTPFLATSAVVGAVVGLALQDTLGNLFAGIALHSEATLCVGDWVNIGARHDGRVDQLSWRAVRLRTWYGDTLTLPNNEVSRHAILNYTQPATPFHSRVLLAAASYSAPPNRVIGALEQLLQQIPDLPAEPRPVVRLVAYRDFSVEYEIRYYLARYEDWRRLEGEILRLIWYHFRRRGIEIPYPVRRVYLHQAEAAAGGEAPSSRLEHALGQIDLFRPLSVEELRTAAARFRPLSYAAGETIIEEGSAGDSFFVIDRGEVQVTKSMGGVKRPLARLMEGQFFGEMALLTGASRAASVSATSDVDLFTLDKAGFHDILQANPRIAIEISAILAARREALSQAAQDLTARYEEAADPGELKARILDRIRRYFGL